MTTSSWSWMPLDPFFSSMPMIRKRTPLNSTCWPTGSKPFPKRWSTTVWPMTATLAWEATSSSVRKRPLCDRGVADLGEDRGGADEGLEGVGRPLGHGGGVGLHRRRHGQDVGGPGPVGQGVHVGLGEPDPPGARPAPVLAAGVALGEDVDGVGAEVPDLDLDLVGDTGAHRHQQDDGRRPDEDPQHRQRDRMRLARMPRRATRKLSRVTRPPRGPPSPPGRPPSPWR